MTIGVELDGEVRPGATVVVRVTLRNDGPDTVTYDWNAVRAGGWISRAGDATWLWDMHTSLVYTGQGHTAEYPPGATDSFYREWDLTMCDGRPLPPGKYTLTGFWNGADKARWVSDTIEFEIG